MNKRIAKKKISHNALVTLWLKNYNANFNAYCKYLDFICNNVGDKELYINASKISFYFLMYDFNQAYKVVSNSIKKSLFNKVANELLMMKKYGMD